MGYDLQPIVWRVHFPKEVETKVVSFTSKEGTLTNSDLEMSYPLLHFLLLESIRNLSTKHTGSLSDNTPTVS